MDDQQTVRDWLEERRQNALTIALGEGVSDPDAWREDADYFRLAIESIDKRDELRALWVEWLGFGYDSSDLLRRVKLAVHGPLRKPTRGEQPTAAPVAVLTVDKRKPLETLYYSEAFELPEGRYQLFIAAGVLTVSTPPAPPGYKLVPIELLQRAKQALGHRYTGSTGRNVWADLRDLLDASGVAETQNVSRDNVTKGGA